MRRRCGRNSIAALAVVLLATGALDDAKTRGQIVGSAPSAGLDLILLVDVSASMSQQPNPGEPRPNDPDLKRWTAVQLVLNLLTFNDRVAVIPFNDVVPATIRFTNGTATYILDPLGEKLVAAQVARSSLLPSIAGFLSNRGYQDYGGTAIFGSLRKASEILSKDAPEGRRRVVILLTDGADSMVGRVDPRAYQNLVSPGPKNDYPNLRAELSSWVETTDSEATPIYTIALGEFARNDVLSHISELSKGANHKIESDRMIVEKFRDILWHLNGSWVREVDLTKPGRILQPLGGLVDVGYLAYQVQGTATVPLGQISTESFSFDPAAEVGEKPNVEARSGSSHSYFFIGRASPNDQQPFGRIDPTKHRLSLDWAGGGGPNDHLYIALRTPFPLFEITAPLQQARFQRLESVRARVKFLSKSAPFEAQDFQLSLRMEPIDFPAGTGHKTVDLAWVPGDEEFQQDLPLRDLPRREGQPVDSFNLVIEAAGISRPGRSTPLAGARLVVGSRTVSVDNQVGLAEIEPVQLSRRNKSRTLAIRTLNPNIKGKADLRLALTRPEGGQRPFELDAITASQDGGLPRSVLANGVSINMVDGKADVLIQLDDAHFPAPGHYINGFLTIAADPVLGLAEARVPLEVSIDTITLGTTPNPQVLTAGNGPVYSQPNTVVESIEGKPVPPGGGVRKVLVELAAPPSAAEFASEELWLETTGGDGTTIKDKRLTLAPGRQFRIGFRPMSDAKRVGQNPYWLRASAGRDVVAAQSTLSLNINAPKLSVVASPDPPMVSPGNRIKFSVAVSFDQPVRGEWHLYFKPDEIERGHPVFWAAGGAKDGLTIELVHPTPMLTYVYSGVDKGTVEFEAIVPEAHPYGVFVTRGTLRGPRIAPVAIELAIAVDDLQLEWLDARSDQWKQVYPAKSRIIDLRRTFTLDMDLNLRVGTMLNRRLDPGKLSLGVFGPFQSFDRADQLSPDQLPERAEDNRELAPHWVAMKMHLPKVISALKDTDYRCAAEIKPTGIGLKVARFEVFASFEE